MKLQNVIDVLEALYPSYLRVDNDPVGLQVGSRQQAVTKILVSMDVDMDVVHEAVAIGADCIISYHALLYAGIHSVDFEDHKGAVVAELIRQGIAVYSLHSRLDTAADGLGQWLAESIGLQNTRVFLPTINEQFGFGRVGELAAAMSVADVTALVKDVFNVKCVRFIGDNEAMIKRVAIVGGSGEEFYPEAVAAEVDLYITGDITFHTAQDAKNSGLNMLDIGHYAEHIVSEKLQQILSKAVGIPVVATTVNTDPFECL
ncbi:Nif3-like dinuclear metal center hexameric protein [Culicoidibacter larvae]|uniref:GTP cyclohydrolase 1 type 2 homolog n=1 Tax=Culicoidibacter larvae TaxID=2579976 RepID=A0A5R8QFM1_9FIRM|nr:Nif3-like dinuclear metal center hexameric protein [Culicoidibacter larvae]TLG76788.1 Nif3-like dinuclear metal center hexameric protein [Culicoidibacter larvae]